MIDGWIDWLDDWMDDWMTDWMTDWLTWLDLDWLDLENPKPEQTRPFHFPFLSRWYSSRESSWNKRLTKVRLKRFPDYHEKAHLNWALLLYRRPTCVWTYHRVALDFIFHVHGLPSSGGFPWCPGVRKRPFCSRWFIGGPGPLGVGHIPGVGPVLWRGKSFWVKKARGFKPQGKGARGAHSLVGGSGFTSVKGSFSVAPTG